MRVVRASFGVTTIVAALLAAAIEPDQVDAINAHGTGTPLGPEDPALLMGAGIASRLGRLFGLTRQTMRLIAPTGAAAGIAAVIQPGSVVASTSVCPSARGPETAKSAMSQ